ncbi:MAG: PIN domain-containing protein [Flammeovirgaceae bacterium]|nr:PIN domain-containing protein [Flammeovirgaceae bacterium]
MMVPRLFLDTNIIFDFFFDRGPFSKHAVKLFELCDEGQVDFYLSALSLANIAYHAQRVKKNPALIIDSLLKISKVIDLKQEHFVAVNNSKFKDYEDGLQYFSALEVNNIEAIISRDKKDFQHSLLPVLTPGEFINSFTR